MFKFAYNSNGLRSLDVLTAIREVARYNYDGIELSLDKDSFNPFSVTDSSLEKIKNVLAEEKIKVSNIATGASDLLSAEKYEPSLLTKEKSKRNLRISCIQKAFRIAKYLGTNIVVISSGFLKDNSDYESTMKNLSHHIKSLLEYGENIIIAIEPEPGMFIGTTDDAIRLIKMVGSGRFRLNLDVGHVVCCEDNYIEKIRKAVKYAVHVHIEDIRDRVHFHLIPGEGEAELNKVLKVLKEENYNGYVSVELYHHSEVYEKALKESLEYLKGCI